MSEHNHDRVKSIADSAIEIEVSVDREAFLEKACADDTALRQEVDAILRQRSDPTEIGDLSEGVGGTIGPYKILQQIGEGGFGVVYLAKQEQPVRRQVAIKVIKLGMDTKQVIARFEAERQALAMMNHPNIARALDAGATERGRPYFVMELVRGEPVTNYCDRHNLSVQDRLRLFQQVCHAVQHAHQKGIIHRDLKPSNVLITMHDGNPVPKVIDFGIAKATNARLTEKTVFTEYRQFVGTPEYMSPEQAEMSGLDIDTRSDVYALGVLLYELLTGTTPFGSRELRDAGYAEIQRIIREETPHRPSTRLSTLDALPSIAAHRTVEAKKLGGLIRGDLDWIVMKAMEKDRTRRYETANGLAMDIERHLAHEPVSASPPSAAYRLRKMVVRHRGAFAAGTLVAAMLVLAIVGTSWGMLWALDERERADIAADHASAKAITAERVSQFMVGLFEAADPDQARGDEPTASELLEAGISQIELLHEEPETQTILRETIAWIFAVQGRVKEGIPLIEKAVAWRRANTPEDGAALGRALHVQANLYDVAGRYDDAESVAHEAVDIRERAHGDRSVELAQSLNTLANVQWHQGALATAESTQLRAYEIRKEILEPDAPDIRQSLHNLGSLRFMQDDLLGAEECYVRAIGIDRRRGDDDSHGFATTLHTLAMVYEQLGRYEEALDLQSQSLPLREHVLGPDHWHTALSLTTIGNIYARTHRAAEAEPLLRRATAIAKESWGDVHPDLFWMQWNLARVLVQLDRADEAAAIMHAIITAIDANDMEGYRVAALNALTEVQLAQELYEDAMASALRVVDVARSEGAAEGSGLAHAIANLARAHEGMGRSGDAAASWADASRRMIDAFGALHPDRLKVEWDRLQCLVAIGMDSEAREVAATIIRLFRSRAEDPATTPREHLLAAKWLVDCPVDVVRDPRRGLARVQKAMMTMGATHPECAAVAAQALQSQGDATAAQKMIRDAIDALPVDDSRRDWLSSIANSLSQ